MSTIQTGAEATFDANGRAQVILGPTIHGIKWTVTRMIISTTSTARSECRVYRGSESSTNLVDSSRSGNDDTSETNINLPSPEKLMFVWSDGTPGSVAIARIEGYRN